jgi:hypothetical protein
MVTPTGIIQLSKLKSAREGTKKYVEFTPHQENFIPSTTIALQIGCD